MWVVMTGRGSDSDRQATMARGARYAVLVDRVVVEPLLVVGAE